MNSQITINMLRTLKWLAILPFLFGCEQARVDALMEELCQKDGGMKIYEKVVLPADQFRESGIPKFFETWNRSSGSYYFRSDTERLKQSKPTLEKLTFSVIREIDKKLLAQYVVYLRIGGGFVWVPGPDPSKSCPSDANDIVFLTYVFLKDN